MRRGKFSISLKDDLAKKVDRFVDGDRYASRSAVIERFLESYLRENRQVVILAGGNSDNLWVHELKTYRPLVEIKRKTLIEHIIEKVVESQYSNIIIVGQKKILTAIIEKIGYGENLGCEIKYVEEKKSGNTANTLKQAKKFLKDTFLFIPCDHYFDFDIKKLEKAHLNGDALMTLIIYGGGKFVWNKTAMVELDGNKITKYWEFPDSKKTNLTSTLIGLAEPEVLNLIPDTTCSLQDDVCNALIRKNKLGGILLSGNFVNVHTKADVELANKL